MRYYKKANISKNSTGSCKYDHNNETGWSYDWWQVCGWFGETYVFNNYSYSSSTRKHQRAISGMMPVPWGKALIVEAPNGLQRGLKQCVDFEYSEIKALIKAIRRKGSRKSTNEERRAEIKSRLAKVRVIKNLIKSGVENEQVK